MYLYSQKTGFYMYVHIVYLYTRAIDCMFTCSKVEVFTFHCSPLCPSQVPSKERQTLPHLYMSSNIYNFSYHVHVHIHINSHQSSYYFDSINLSVDAKLRKLKLPKIRYINMVLLHVLWKFEINQKCLK